MDDFDDFDEFDEEEEETRELDGMEKTVEDLNEKFFKLLCRLKKHKEAFGKQQFYDCMLQNLFDLYKLEYERIYKDYKLKANREIFRKNEKIASLTPHAWRFLFFHRENIPAKLIIEDENIKSEEFYRKYEAENDAARPEYMRKLWLTRWDKKEARKAAKQAKKEAKRAVRAAKKSARRSLRAERKNGGKQGEAVQPNGNDAEAKKQARLRALEESRKQKKREQERAATSPKSPKTGTQSGGSESSSKA